jgi:lipoate-protein ligase A
VVLGSTQRSDVIDHNGSDVVDPYGSDVIDVVRRRSGGGAVLVSPDDPVWIDLWVPAGDELWTTDVTRAFAWLGAAWGSAFGQLGLTGIEVQGPGPGPCTRWSSLICFGGVGAGEVTVDGRKVVGLAQRRDRRGAWFHGACLVRWDPTALLGALRFVGDERAAAAAGLSAAATGVADAAIAQGSASAPSADGITVAFLDALP